MGARPRRGRARSTRGCGRSRATSAGPVITPADAGVRPRAARLQRALRRRPAARRSCSRVYVADVRAAVAWARRNGDPHRGALGRPQLRRLLDHDRRSSSTCGGSTASRSRRPAPATIGAGARLIDVYAALAGHGRAIPAGSCPTVGIGGLALGGGVGLAVAQARARRATTSSRSGSSPPTAACSTCDAERSTPTSTGPAAAAGAATSGSSRTSSCGRTRSRRSRTSSSSWPWAQAAEVVARWQAFAPHAPDALFSICSLATGGRRPRCSVFGQFLGCEARCARCSRRSRAVAGAQLTTGTSSYLDAQLRWAGCLGKTLAECHLPASAAGHARPRDASRAKSDYVRRAAPGGRRSRRSSAGSSARQAQPARLGRAPPRLLRRRDQPRRARARPRSSTATRSARSSTSPTGTRRRPAAARSRWLRGFHAAMRPYVSGFAYQNYIDRDLAGWQHAYYGSNYPRLRQVKRQYDPDNVFRFRAGDRAGRAVAAGPRRRPR